MTEGAVAPGDANNCTIGVLPLDGGVPSVSVFFSEDDHAP